MSFSAQIAFGSRMHRPFGSCLGWNLGPLYLPQDLGRSLPPKADLRAIRCEWVRSSTDNWPLRWTTRERRKLAGIPCCRFCSRLADPSDAAMPLSPTSSWPTFAEWQDSVQNFLQPLNAFRGAAAVSHEALPLLCGRFCEIATSSSSSS
jgi:hypothetical protein